MEKLLLTKASLLSLLGATLLFSGCANYNTVFVPTNESCSTYSERQAERKIFENRRFGRPEMEGVQYDIVHFHKK